MNQLITSSNVFWESLGQAILHSFWQGFVIMGIAALILKLIKANHPGLRYWVAVGGIMTFFMTFMWSLVYFLSTVSPDTTIFIFNSPENIAKAIGNVAEATEGWRIRTLLQPASLVYLWLIGFLIFSIRLVVSYGFVHFIGSKSILDTRSSLFAQMKRISAQMGINKKVELRFSDKVSTIFTYGNIKPVIIWPMALINALTPEEAEVVLAHELAHIKRNDYTVKFLIGIANTILYYHPVIWWLNWVVNNERECACDLQAVATTGDQTLLASALLKLQEEKLRLAHISANGFSDKNSFSNRIKRIFNMPIKQSLGRGKLTILLLFVGIGLFAYGYRDKLHDIKKEDIKEQVSNFLPDFVKRLEDIPLSSQTMVIDTTKPQEKVSSSAVIIKNDGVKSIKMEMEDGEIKKLEVDGKEVAKEDYDKYSKDIKSLKGHAVGRGGGRTMSIFGDGIEPMVFDFDDLKMFEDTLKIRKGFNMPFTITDDVFVVPDMHIFGDSGFVFKYDFNSDEFREKQEKWMKDHEEQIKKYQDKAMQYNEKMQKYWEQNAEKFAKQGERWKEKAHEWEEAAKTYHSEGKNFNYNFDGLATIPGMEFRTFGGNGSNFEQQIGSQLNKDGFLLPGKENTVKLTGKYLKINGDKMPEVVYEKYKRIFEESTGLPLSKDTNIEFKMMGDNGGSRKYRAF
ncbi:MAG: M48 family metalloprotease [Saprospiraceae bacterium]|nr:M48 family metalloprotease [Saprospiraceae bacterium]